MCFLGYEWYEEDIQDELRLWSLRMEVNQPWKIFPFGRGNLIRWEQAATERGAISPFFPKPPAAWSCASLMTTETKPASTFRR